MKYDDDRKIFKTKGFYITCFLGLFALLSVITVENKIKRDEKSEQPQELAKLENTTLPSQKTWTDLTTNIPKAVEPQVTTPKSDSSISVSNNHTRDLDGKASETTNSSSQKKSSTSSKENTDNSETVTNVMNTEEQNQGLTWPIQGDILIDYSDSTPVYFKTLDQYKLNPALIIAGKKDAAVVSACNCTITDVKRNDETGLTIIATSGDYTYIYGQLNNPKVAKGDQLKEGEQIASLAAPTDSFEQEGCNLYFQVKEKDKNINPLLLLK